MSGSAQKESDELRVTRLSKLVELPQLLTPDELRIYLGLGRTTVYELLRCGKLRHVGLGRGIRIPKEAITEINCNGTSEAINK